MSGVVAVLQRDGGAAPEPVLRSMLARLRHRSVDGAGARISGAAGIAHGLLAATEEDLLARQPLASVDGRRVIAADARLDNREDLHASLAIDRPLGEVSDAELILRAHERWGEDCARRLLGDFAFVIWDERLRRLFAARDHIGVRALYYHVRQGAFRCASEMQALFADPGIERRYHRPSLGLFLAWEYEERHQTLYEGVFAIPPAHTLVVTDHEVRLSRYWEPDPFRTIRHGSDAEYAAHFGSVLEEAVRCRLRARGPVGAELSGGVDSSSVVGLCERLRRSGRVGGPPVTLITARYPGLAVDETEYSDAVAAHWGLPLLTYSALDRPERHRPDPALQIPDVYYDVGVLDTIPEVEMLVARGVRAILTGTGSDQLFRHTGHETGEHLRRGRLGAALQTAGVAGAPLSGDAWRRLARAAARRAAPAAARRLLRRVRRRSSDVPAWITPPVARETGAAIADRDRSRAVRAYPSEVSRALCEDLGSGLSVLLCLSRLGNIAASRGAELRHPFFDVRVVEHALALPDVQRAGTSMTKPVLRRALGRDLPDVVRKRTTWSEASCYYERAFLGDHEGAVRRLLARSRLEQEGIIDGAAVRRMLDAPSEFVHHVLTVTSLELWLRQSIEGAPSAPQPRISSEESNGKSEQGRTGHHASLG